MFVYLFYSVDMNNKKKTKTATFCFVAKITSIKQIIKWQSKSKTTATHTQWKTFAKMEIDVPFLRF